MGRSILSVPRVNELPDKKRPRKGRSSSTVAISVGQMNQCPVMAVASDVAPFSPFLAAQ